MDVEANRITFWFGCNMLRHAEMIRLSIMLLERVGYDVSAAGGPAYCCGTAHDHQPHGASNMAARTVARFNEASDAGLNRSILLHAFQGVRQRLGDN